MNIDEFLDKYNYDIRKTKDARWIDQKCTIDVLNIIADCVVKFVTKKEDKNISFTAADIWKFPYSAELIEMYFGKVPVLNSKSKNEYDKFFSQPLKLLAYSHIAIINR